MTPFKRFTPLIVALALVGCHKPEKKADNPASAPSAQTTTVAPASATNLATATTDSANTATAMATTNMTPAQHKEAREQIMKSWKKANQTMGGMVKDPATFNAATFKEAAAKLNQDPWAHFTADAKGGDAKANIWTDNAGFQQKITAFKTAATALNTAAATATSADAVKTQFANVGARCKGCHETFKAD